MNGNRCRPSRDAPMHARTKPISNGPKRNEKDMTRLSFGNTPGFKITKNGIKTKKTSAHPKWFKNAQRTPANTNTGVK